MENGNRKSIPFSTIVEEAYEIPTGYYPRIDYLPIIQQLIDAKCCGFESEEKK